MTTNSACNHEMQELDEAELADLRKQARSGRPPMAWVEAAGRCSLCNELEATVSWFGQAYRVPVSRSQDGALSVRWPKRSDMPSASPGMG